jgi:hypothetical protein
MGETEFPGWDKDKFGTLTLTIAIAGQEIRLATVTHDAGADIYTTFIGRPVSGNQLGRIDSSQDRAVEKAETFLAEKLRKLL